MTSAEFMADVQKLVAQPSKVREMMEDWYESCPKDAARMVHFAVNGKHLNEDMMEEARDLVVYTILNVNFKTQDWALVRMNIKKALTNLFYKKLKHKPMIIPVIIETN
jgi:hypothetical protein